LRRFGEDDADWYAAMNADTEVMRFIGEGEPYPRDRSDDSLTSILAHWEQHEFGLWAAERLDTGQPIGFVGLAIPSFLPRILPAVEVGWRLSRPNWGQGFATEAASAALDHGFATLGLERIVSITVHDNHASQRVMARLGLETDCAEVHPGLGIVVQVRSLSAERWAARAMPAAPAGVAPGPGTG
jgi:RimJ/RimL family protein N-acetyltransferase